MKANKKKVIGSCCLLLLTSAIISAIVASVVWKKPNQSQIKSDLSSAKVNVAFDIQPKTKELLKAVFANQIESENYVYEQNLIDDDKISELKLALTYYNPHLTKGLENKKASILDERITYRKTKLRARDFLFDSISKDWYWILKHLNILEFAYNPYPHNQYKKIANETAGYGKQVQTLSAVVNPVGKFEFDLNQLPLGFVYELNALQQGNWANNLKIIQELPYNKRVIDRINTLDQNNNLVINFLLPKYKNQKITAVYVNQNNKKVKLEATADAKGIVSFHAKKLTISDDWRLIKLYNQNQQLINDQEISQFHQQTFNRLQLEELLVEQKPESLTLVLNQNENIKQSKLDLNFIIRAQAQIIERINDPQITDFVVIKSKFPLQTAYQEIKTIYLQYGTNKIMRLIVLNHNNTKHVRLDYDMFVFKQPITDLKSIANLIDQAIIAQYNNQISQAFANNEKISQEQKVLLANEIIYSNYDPRRSSFFTSMNYKIMEAMEKANIAVNIYTMRNIANHVLAKIIKQQDLLFKNKPPVQVYHYPKKYIADAIDHNLDIVQDEQALLLKKTDIIINQISLDAFENDTNGLQRLAYIKQQKQDAEQIRNELKAFANKFKILQQKNVLLTVTKNNKIFLSNVHAYFDENYELHANDVNIGPNDYYHVHSITDPISKQTYQNISSFLAVLKQQRANLITEADKEYKTFLSKNWYFVLKHLAEFDLVFLDWFRLSSLKALTPNQEIPKHSQAFENLLASKEKYKTYQLIDRTIDELKQSDLSKEHPGLPIQYFLVKNKALFELSLPQPDDENKAITIQPYAIVFKEAKVKLSVAIFSELLHLAFVHGDPQQYKIFENDLINKYQSQLLLNKSANK